jgi:hypothetical protein
VDTVTAQGLDDDFYCAVGTPDEAGLSETSLTDV